MGWQNAVNVDKRKQKSAKMLKSWNMNIKNTF